MTQGVRLRDGVEIEFSTGETVVLDGSAGDRSAGDRSAGDHSAGDHSAGDRSTGDHSAVDPSPVDTDGPTTVVSHAHGDHLVDSVDRIVASDLTAALAASRRGGDAGSGKGRRESSGEDGTGRSEKKGGGTGDAIPPTAVDHPAIDLVDAGHIAGSRAAVLTDPDTGRTCLYTGDCCTRDRFHLDGFDPVTADVLVVETTYGTPEYAFPPTAEVVARIHSWLEETMDEVVILFGYALGRAQKLQRILAGSPRDRVFVTEAIARLDAVIEDHLDVSFRGRTYDSDVDLEPGDALVLPMQTSRLPWIESLVERHDPITAGFSGWATDDSFVYRRGFDEGFVLSDHCDFRELLEVVETVDPERVYTHHGFAEAFASHVTAEVGCETRALKPHQSTFADF